MIPRKITLSPNQSAAVTAAGNLLVRAGAGSGKTEVLARRFAALVAGDIEAQPPLEPVRIAAITFTEKAALDMRVRIGRVLEERRAEADEAAKPLLERARRTLPLARISTIHGFCGRILRENAVEAGLDPDFEILDQYESETLFERVCREELIDGIRRGDAGAEFLVRARRISGPQREGALEIIRRIFTEVRLSGASPESIAQLTETNTRRTEARADRVAELARSLVEAVDKLLKALGRQSGDLAEFWAIARASVLNFDSASSPEAVELLRDLVMRLPNAMGKRGKFVKPIQELLIKHNSRFGLRGELIEAWGEQRAIGPARAIAGFVARVGDAFAQAIDRERVLTFDELLVRTRDLLRDHRGVPRRYRTELGAILVDEYQDTNPLQDELVELLTAPADGEPAPPQLFIVGDEKQSIYRFRGADVRVFNRARQSVIVEKSLSDNRRSTPNILGFVNGLGASMMKVDDPRPEDYRIVWREHHELHAKRKVIARNYPIEIISEATSGAAPQSSKGRGKGKAPAGDKRALEGRALAARIAQIVAEGEPITDPEAETARPARYRDIAILFRAFSDIAIYEQAMIESGIPCYTVKGRGFYACREVIDLIELLTAIDEREDSLALAAILRSPLLALSDECLLEMGLRLHGAETPRFASLAQMFDRPKPEFGWLSKECDRAEQAWSIINELRQMRGREPLIEILERALELTDYENVLAGLSQGEQRVANVRKLIELARRFDSHRFFSFHDFVSYLRRLTEAEPYEPQAQILGEDENVVRLMTVHQAKGLEFPIVMIADAGRGPNNNHQGPLFDPAHGLLVCDTCGSGQDEIPNDARDAYAMLLKEQEAAESKRIFYVALTRARDRLIVSEGGGKQEWAKWLRDYIGNVEFERLEAAPDGDLLIERDAVPLRLRRIDSITHPVSAPHPAGSNHSDRTIPPRRPAPIRHDGALVISPSALADFARCPRQYWLRHGLQIPEDDAGFGQSGSSTAMGSVAHEVLERTRIGGDREATRAQIIELTTRLGRAAGLDEKTCGKIAADLIRYAESESIGEPVVGREMPFMLNVADGFFVRGQIDVLVRRDDQLIVRDYKYSRRVEASQYQVQMECYALAAATVWPDLEIGAEIVALRDHPATVPVGLAESGELRQNLTDLGHQLEDARQKNDFPRKPESAASCRTLGCGYIARCWKQQIRTAGV